MNKWIAATVILSTVTFLLRIIGGGEEVHKPFLQSELTPLYKTRASVLWYLVSLILAVNAITLTMVLYKPIALRPIMMVVLAQFLVFAGFFLFYRITQNENLLVIPQWAIFLMLSAMCVMGLHKKPPLLKMSKMPERSV